MSCCVFVRVLRLSEFLTMNVVGVLASLGLLVAAAVAQVPKPCGECSLLYTNRRVKKKNKNK